MDPAAAATDTESALRSALDAAYRERESLTQRIDEVDQLIADLSQAAEGSGEAPTRQARATRQTGRKSSTKATATKGTKKSAKKSGKKSAKRGQRKATTKRAAKRASTGRRSTSGGNGIGRTDRVVYLIADAAEPLSTGEVRTQLSEYEPGVTSKLVSASLSYAERKGRIRRVDDGRWVAIEQPAQSGQRSAASS